jgi:cell division protein FtsL
MSSARQLQSTRFEKDMKNCFEKHMSDMKCTINCFEKVRFVATVIVVVVVVIIIIIITEESG